MESYLMTRELILIFKLRENIHSENYGENLLVRWIRALYEIASVTITTHYVWQI